MIQILYQLAEIGDLKSFLKYQKYWVFCSNNNDNWDINDMDNPEIYKRITVVNNCLQFKRLAKDPLYKGLRPRIELRPMDHLLRKNIPYRIDYEFRVLKGTDFRGMIFQLMDHFEGSKNPMPTFQLEIRDGLIHCRNSKLPSVEAEIFPFAKVVENEWVSVSLAVKLSGDTSGYIICYHKGKQVYNRSRKITGSQTGRVQVSIGIYAVEGVELITEVRKLNIIQR